MFARRNLQTDTLDGKRVRESQEEIAELFHVSKGKLNPLMQQLVASGCIQKYRARSGYTVTTLGAQVIEHIGRLGNGFETDGGEQAGSTVGRDKEKMFSSNKRIFAGKVNLQPEPFCPFLSDKNGIRGYSQPSINRAIIWAASRIPAPFSSRREITPIRAPRRSLLSRASELVPLRQHTPNRITQMG